MKTKKPHGLPNFASRTGTPNFASRTGAPTVVLVQPVGVSKKYHALLSVCIPNGGIDVEWSPKKPARLTKSMLRRYRRARSKLAQRRALLTGADVVTVESDGRVFKSTPTATTEVEPFSRALIEQAASSARGLRGGRTTRV